MDLNFIKKLIKLVENSEVTDLEIEESGTRIKVAKKIRISQVPVQNVSPVLPAASSAPLVEQKEAKAAQAEEEVSSGYHEIRSPIVGTFYRAPAPDADSYVQVGDTVSPGSVLCIVEAMKLMNEIESDVSGKIVKILVENGKPVEYNQPLFLIQP
ncbi:MAG TPA: acetyl-CoA carboxylase biotin carboxyl carrier protein [Ignavibacteriaceae bacterium]|nr:acetyl-CoA carboxylase biotin carboxyl carrier protein [Ignavibacteriaceae bacterium]